MESVKSHGTVTKLEPTNSKPKSPPKAVLSLETDDEGIRRLALNKAAMPGLGGDDFLAMLTSQILDTACVDRCDDTKAAQGINGVVAAFHAIAPEGELESMLAGQMIACHMAAMDCYIRANRAGDIRRRESHLNQANKLSRTYTTLLEGLNRHRGKTGQQKMTVEHVHVYDGGQAIVTGEVGGSQKTSGTTPCAKGR